MLVLFVLWLCCLPNPLFKNPTATVIESKEGVLLGARIAKDGQWRFPKADTVPSRFEQCILHFEDEYFYEHPGFNPVSIAKAIWTNTTTKKRRGGSTITQQVIRLSRKNKKRSYAEKLIEVFMATRLEVGYSKKEILNFYASNAPFGGNVVGLETASWRYFGIPSSELSWGQSASLAVLPNAPSLIFPGKNEQLLLAKRNRLLLKLKEKKVIDQTTYNLAIEERLPGKPVPLPQIAAHLSSKVAKEHQGKHIRTTIAYRLQTSINQIVKEHHRTLSQNEINNIAVLLLDVTTREVIAYVGNAPTTKNHNNYVDIINSNRSTGSILKPFLFASALEGGEILPNSLISDIPTVIDGYNPQNFNKKYNGAVPASEALSRSLNIPAVTMLRNYGLERFYNKLQQMNMTSIHKPANHYGLSLILGGAESSLWEITAAYAAMASTLNYFTISSSEYRETEFLKPIYIKGQQHDFGKTISDAPIFNAGSIYETFKALQSVHRPLGEENWQYFSNTQPIAWKTGTSFGFKDAWAVGVTSKYAIGVWVGNADGEGRPGLTGIQTAAPVLFDVLSLLPKMDWFNIPHDELIEAEICKKSGHLASVYCENATMQLIPKAGIRTNSCEYHQKIFLSVSGNERVNSSCYELNDMQQKNWFALPPVQEYYYANLHPEYKPLPPYKQDCLKEGEQLMEFIFPKRKEAIILATDFDEQVNEVIFKLAHRAPDTKVYWYLNQTFLGTTQTFHELAVSLSPGVYILKVVDQQGNELQQALEIDKG